MPEVVDYWMKYCAERGLSFEFCARGAQVLTERDDDGNLSNESYYMAHGFDNLRRALDIEALDPGASDFQTIDWERKRYLDQEESKRKRF